jgi:hypothetical protein
VTQQAWWIVQDFRLSTTRELATAARLDSSTTRQSHAVMKPTMDALEGNGFSSPAAVRNVLRAAGAVEAGETHG